MYGVSFQSCPAFMHSGAVTISFSLAGHLFFQETCTHNKLTIAYFQNLPICNSLKIGSTRVISKWYFQKLFLLGVFCGIGTEGLKWIWVRL